MTVPTCTFGMVGMGMFMYGKRAGRMISLGSGAALMALPYFIPNAVALLIVCSVLTLLSWLLPDARGERA